MSEFTAVIEITKQSGEVIRTLNYQYESNAHDQFDKLAEIKWPMTYEGLVMNLSEYRGSVWDGEVRLVAINPKGYRYERRSLYRKP